MQVYSAAELKLSQPAIQRAVRAGRLRRLRRGYFVAAEHWPDDNSASSQRIRIALLTVAAERALTTARPSHQSAAILAGLPTWSIPSRPCLTLPPKSLATAPDVHIHRAPLPPAHLDSDGITAARTVVDIAREYGERDAIVVADAALAQSFTSYDAIQRVVAECVGWPGIRQARDVLRLANRLSESPLESVSRLAIARLGLPDPVPQVQIRDARGRFVARVDLYWDDLGVVGEVDGRAKYSGPGDLWAEKRRQEDLEDLGLVVVRWGLPELLDESALLRKLTTGFARAARRPPGARCWLAITPAHVR